MPRGHAASLRSRPNGAISTAGGPGAASPPPSAGSALASLTVDPIPGPAQTVAAGIALPTSVRECPPESVTVRQSPPVLQRCDRNHIPGVRSGSAMRAVMTNPRTPDIGLRIILAESA